MKFTLGAVSWLILPLAVLASAALAAMTPAAAGGPHALFIMDANTGATLADQDGNDPRYPASLTKMMTLYMAFEGIEQGRLTMKTKIKISQAAANAAPSKLELAVGDEIALEDAIMALITKSANDIAIAIAEHIGGSEQNFARLMTNKARDLGMKATTFKNASGLPDSGQTTTARDMVTLGVRLYDDFPRYFPLFSTRAYNYNGSTYKNHNTLMLQMPGINGIKTGYTHASGFNLVSSLQQDGKHVIGAIFGGETAGSRNAHMRVALTRAMAKASTAKTRKPVLVARAEEKKAAAAAEQAKKAKLAAAQAAKAAAAKEAASQAAAVVAAAKAASAPVEIAQAQPAQPPALKFEIAKVRTVTAGAVTGANTQAPPQQVAAAASQPAPVASAPAPKSQPFAQASADPRLSDLLATRTSPSPAPVANATARQPSSFEQQISGYAQNIGTGQPQAMPVVDAAPAPQSAPARAHVPAEVATPAQAQASVELGRPPSSLGAQLAQLTAQPAGMAQPSYRLKGPQAPVAPAPAAATGKGFEIQIGAYVSAAEADKRLQAAANQFPVLKGYTPARHTVTVGGKTMYRARFSGFDQAAAHAACAELTKQAVNCLALKAE